ncbi:MAG: hypothetical protein VXX31_11540, partial [Planctomycetota bacterium]|nr:hypothetical protein [Planctomycetota bacterium]
RSSEDLLIHGYSSKELFVFLFSGRRAKQRQNNPHFRQALRYFPSLTFRPFFKFDGEKRAQACRGH